MTITYEDYMKGAQPDITDFSTDALYERRRYLTEYIDKLPDKLDGFDLMRIVTNNPKRMIISAGPGSGKTTAMRQFVVNNIKDGMMTGIVAFNRIDDVHSFYYDAIAQASLSQKKFIKCLTSDVEDSDNYDKLLWSNWVVTTHARLLIEPELVLYRRLRKNTMNNKRDVLFVDEIPSNMSRSIGWGEALGLVSLLDEKLQVYVRQGQIGIPTETIRQTYAISDEIRMLERDHGKIREMIYIIINDLFKQAIDKNPEVRENLFYINNDPIAFTESLANKNSSGITLRECINKLYKGYKNYNSNYEPVLLARVVEYLTMEYIRTKTCSDANHDRDAIMADNYVRRKLGKDYLVEEVPPKVDTKIYHSIYNLYIDNIILFDGTADIALNDTDWKVCQLEKPGLKRSIEVNKLVPINTGSVKRSSHVDTILKVYSDRINKIVKRYDADTKFLVYCWKSSKSNREVDKDLELDKELSDRIRKDYGDEEADRVSIITYQSGRERVTSAYRDTSVAIILGEYFIPESSALDIKRGNLDDQVSIDDSTKAEEGKISAINWTLSLMIQFIYRTQARVGKPIDIYIDNKYNKDFIKKFIKYLGVKKLSAIEQVAVGDGYESLENAMKGKQSIEVTYDEIREIIDYHSKDNSILTKKLEKAGYIVSKGSSIIRKDGPFTRKKHRIIISKSHKSHK